MNKPLTKEERENVALVVHAYTSPDCGVVIRPETFQALAAAEAFWREAVKNLPEFIDESDGCHPPQCSL